MLAAAVVVLLVMLFVAGALIARRQRKGSRGELESLVGKVVEVSSMHDSRGPVHVASVEGSLVAVGDSNLLLRPTLLPIPPRFARMVTNDGSLRIPLREVLEVTCAGHVVRIR